MTTTNCCNQTMMPRHVCILPARALLYSFWGKFQRTTFESCNWISYANLVSLFILSFVSVFCAFWTGLSGCWRRSAGAITATAILMLLTCLLAAGAMGLWHTVEFFEKEKVVGDEFYQQWNSVLRDNTRISYDWSYVLAWAGVATSLIAAILLSGAAVCLRSEREKEEQLNLQYLMPGMFPLDARTENKPLLINSILVPLVSSLPAKTTAICVRRLSTTSNVSSSSVPRIAVWTVPLLRERTRTENITFNDSNNEIKVGAIFFLI